MGYYINVDSKGNALSASNKHHDLIIDGATVISPSPKSFIPNLVCVVDNGLFQAAGFCYDECEFNDWADPSDTRKKVWLVYERAAELSGYLQDHPQQ